MDDTGLSLEDRGLDLIKVQSGGIVVRGSMENRVETFHGAKYTLSYVVVSAVERGATAAESARCLAN